jgi:hypothetical protein
VLMPVVGDGVGVAVGNILVAVGVGVFIIGVPEAVGVCVAVGGLVAVNVGVGGMKGKNSFWPTYITVSIRQLACIIWYMVVCVRIARE